MGRWGKLLDKIKMFRNKRFNDMMEWWTWDRYKRIKKDMEWWTWERYQRTEEKMKCQTVAEYHKNPSDKKKYKWICKNCCSYLEL